MRANHRCPLAELTDLDREPQRGGGQYGFDTGHGERRQGSSSH